MDSNYIKEAVSKVNAILDTNDFDFNSNEGKSRATNLIVYLVTHFENAPTTAAAIMQYLHDNGFNVANIKGDAHSRFMRLFGPRIAQFSTSDIERLSRIIERLFQH
jgi:hypothetical protein